MVSTLCVGLPVASEFDLGTGTVRVRNDLIEMVRVVCTHDRNPDGSRLKAIELLDSILRKPLTDRYNATMNRIAKLAAENERKGKKG